MSAAEGRAHQPSKAERGPAKRLCLNMPAYYAVGGQNPGFRQTFELGAQHLKHPKHTKHQVQKKSNLYIFNFPIVFAHFDGALHDAASPRKSYGPNFFFEPPKLVLKLEFSKKFQKINTLETPKYIYWRRNPKIGSSKVLESRVGTTLFALSAFFRHSLSQLWPRNWNFLFFFSTFRALVLD